MQHCVFTETYDKINVLLGNWTYVSILYFKILYQKSLMVCSKLRLLLDYDTGLFAFPIIKINMWTQSTILLELSFVSNC